MEFVGLTKKSAIMEAKYTDKILHFEEEEHTYNLPETDIKAEVLASGLREQNYDPERTLILRLGDARRGFSKDIEKVCSEYSQYDLTDYLYIYVNRKSLYDELPEGLFHQPIYQKDRNSKEEILDEIRIHREEEFFARRFFKPFEIAIDHMLVDFQHKERKMDKMNVHTDFVNAFVKQWPVLRYFPLKQAVMFIKMLPFIESITNSLEKISQSMSILLDVPTRVKRGSKAFVTVDECLVPPLGKCILGENFIAGNSFDDGSFRILMEVGPISAHKMSTFLPGTNNDKILHSLMDLFLPADKEIEVRYVIEREDAIFKLESKEDVGSFLGISTYLANCN